LLIFVVTILIITSLPDYIIHNNELFISLISVFILAPFLIIEVVRYTGYSIRDIVDGLERKSKSKLGRYELVIDLLYLAIILSVFIVILLLPLPDFIFNCVLLSVYIFILSFVHPQKDYLFEPAKPLRIIIARIAIISYFIFPIVLLASYWYPLLYIFMYNNIFSMNLFVSTYPLLIVGSAPTLYIVKTSMQILFPRSKWEEAPTELKEIIDKLSEEIAIKNVKVMLTPGSPNVMFSFSTEESNYLVFSNFSLKFFDKEELKAIALHELTHLKFDGLIRFYDCLKPKLQRLLVVSYLQSFVLLPIIIILLAVKIFLYVFGSPVVYWLSDRGFLLVYIFTLAEKGFPILIKNIFSFLLNITVYPLILAALIISFSALGSAFMGSMPLELREARADFISALSFHKSLKSALLKLSRSRKFDFGTFSELYFFLPRREKKKAVRLSDITPKARYLIIPQRNAHPSLSQRLLIIDLAGKIASDGLDVKFLRSFSEKEFAFLPNSEKLLKAAEKFREKGKITLKDSLEHGLSPSDLFSLIIFMEKRGIISIPYGTG
jgi:Zn-dependent protease with chaperone function